MRDFLKAPIRLARTIAAYRSIVLRLTHLPSTLRTQCGWAHGSVAPADRELVQRLIRAYLQSAPGVMRTGESMWDTFFHGRQQDIHAALVGGDFNAVAGMLQDPASCDLFWGFDSTCRSEIRSAPFTPQFFYGGQLILDPLIRVAEAVGANRLSNPESARRLPRRARIDADKVLASLDARFGHAVEVPNIFPKEFGLVTARGILSYRVPHAIFQAWRIAEVLKGIAKPKVLEIGGGLGRTAFYARKFGIADYTIVDLPLTSLAQGYYLGRTLGADQVVLNGEPPSADRARIKLIPGEAFLASNERYDLILNVDSLTEMARDMAAAYVGASIKKAPVLVSINHEANPFTFHGLMRELGQSAKLTRTPYWLRTGYVEEVWQSAGRAPG